MTQCEHAPAKDPSTGPAAEDWNRLLSLMHTLARGLMRGRDRDRRDSMDIVQSLATDLLTADSGFLAISPESQRKFLAISLRHKLAAYWRSDSALKRGGPGGQRTAAAEELASTGAPGPRTIAIQADDLRIVATGLDELEPESRAVLVLYASGVPHAAIAEALQTTDEAVRQRYVRAKRDLIILTYRRAGESWESVAAACGLDAERARHRYEKITGRPPDVPK